MSPCLVSDDGNLTICVPGPMVAFRWLSIPERWCFRCRKRRLFRDLLLGETGRTYYEPQWERECSEGHRDGDLFPGWSRDAA